ncbi:MAG: hypothetical protein HY650_13055 [Acidobacteria bacterium]|nr:hypothetical protein [Acidobacteriota bacterium]
MTTTKLCPSPFIRLFGGIRSRIRGVLFVGLSVVLLMPSWTSFAQTGGVHVLFSLDTPAGGPFPSDRFTVPDETQNTALRINLPKPDCQTNPSDCEDLDVLNTLDGFNMSPRISIPFDGPIDVNSVNSQTIFLVSLGNTLDPGDLGGRRIGINEVVWDVASNTLHVWSDELLDQHTRYGLFVTRGIRDARGDPIEASAAFRTFLATGMGDYRTALVAAIRAAVLTGISESDIVSASVFTTQSATAILEKIRDQIKAATPAPADFRLGPGGSRTVFNLDQVSGITLNRQAGVNPPTFVTSQINLSVLGISPGAVGQIAFGKYLSPDYLVHPGEYIPAVGTRTGQPVVQRMNEVHFNLYLPSAVKPAAGWPVAIFGHGQGSNKEEARLIAATMAAHGIATIAINASAHGGGELSTLTVNQTGGGSVTISVGGRSIDQNGNGQILPSEGFQADTPRRLIVQRDTNFQQTPADLIQLVRVIDLGMDVDGDGQADVDPARIYSVGESGAGTSSMELFAVEPHVRAAAPWKAGGGSADAYRLTPGNRSGVGTRFAERQPSLLNSPGITSLDGVSATAPYFNENKPLRNGASLAVRMEDGTTREIRSPVINTAAGAMQIQQWFDRLAWAYQAGNPAAYALHLRKILLPGMSARPVLLTFSRGDRVSPNPINTQIMLAGDLADRTMFYRTDLALAENPLVRGFNLGNIESTVPLLVSITRGALEQIAVFFESNGTRVITPEPSRFWEVPIALPLPEALNFIP